MRAAILLLLGLLTTAAMAQESQPKSPLAWLTGTWRIDDSRGWIEESWSEPATDGGMTGHLRIVRGGAVVFYQLLVIETDRGEPLLFIRHFNRALQPRETEPLVFRLSIPDSSEVTFEGKQDNVKVVMSYRLAGPDTLAVEVTRGERREEFRYRRVRTGK